MWYIIWQDCHMITPPFPQTLVSPICHCEKWPLLWGIAIYRPTMIQKHYQKIWKYGINWRMSLMYSSNICNKHPECRCAGEVRYQVWDWHVTVKSTAFQILPLLSLVCTTFYIYRWSCPKFFRIISELLRTCL